MAYETQTPDSATLAWIFVGRRLRVEYEGAVHHVTARGNARALIFLTDADRHRFLALLDAVTSAVRWRCHAYCMMGNHYHLLIETPSPNLAEGMRTLNSAYARSVNRVHARTGHVFGDRYDSVLVKRESHLLEAARYVVLNPVRAGICLHPGQWPWSSFAATAGLARVPRFLSVEWLLDHFAADRHLACARYADFVVDAETRDPFGSSHADV